MKKNNLFLKSASVFFKAVFFISLCAAISFAIVLPLWLFATKSPRPYTYASLALISSILIFKIVKTVGKTPPRKLIKTCSSLAIILGGIAASVLLVLDGKRFLAIPVLALIPVLHFLVSSIFRETNFNKGK